jgi:hypothetical protein
MLPRELGYTGDEHAMPEKMQQGTLERALIT